MPISRICEDDGICLYYNLAESTRRTSYVSGMEEAAYNPRRCSKPPDRASYLGRMCVLVYWITRFGL